MRRAVDDVGSDVERFAGKVADPVPVGLETAAAAPFTSRRDAFVTEMKGRSTHSKERSIKSRPRVRVKPR